MILMGDDLNFYSAGFAPQIQQTSATSATTGKKQKQAYFYYQTLSKIRTKYRISQMMFNDSINFQRVPSASDTAANSRNKRSQQKSARGLSSLKHAQIGLQNKKSRLPQYMSNQPSPSEPENMARTARVMGNFEYNHPQNYITNPPIERKDRQHIEFNLSRVNPKALSNRPKLQDILNQQRKQSRIKQHRLRFRTSSYNKNRSYLNSEQLSARMSQVGNRGYY